MRKTQIKKVPKGFKIDAVPSKKETRFFSAVSGKFIAHLIFIIAILLVGLLFFDYKSESLKREYNSKTAQLRELVGQQEGDSNKVYNIENNTAKSVYEELSSKNLEKMVFDKKVSILMYHYIEEVDSSVPGLRKNLTVEPKDFDAQMEFLHKNGYRTMTLSEYFDKVAKRDDIPDKTVLITVDDGYRSFFENAAPILNKYNFTATAFIIANSVGYSAYMDWDQIAILANQGIEIGSHTLTHPNLNNVGYDGLENEIKNSKKKIEKKLGITVNFFCYPGGNFSLEAEKIAREAGYKGAVTVMSGYSISNKNMFELPRFRINNSMRIEGFEWTVERATQK